MKVIDFIKWGLTHAKRTTLPTGAILPVATAKVGSAGEWEYLYGTTGQKVTQAMLDSKYKSFYAKNGWTRAQFDKATANWVKLGKIVCDCQGVEDYYSKSQTNANGNYMKYCTDKGLCKSISRPYVLGEAVFNGTGIKKTHVGWVCGFMPDGDVLVMEERGLAYGFVITQMSKRPWKYRGLMTKRYQYENESYMFTRILKFGCKGDDVKELKSVLIQNGYKGLNPSNGNFLASTQKLVKQFQQDKGLTADGIVGAKTYEKLGVKYKL